MGLGIEPATSGGAGDNDLQFHAAAALPGLRIAEMRRVTQGNRLIIQFERDFVADIELDLAWPVVSQRFPPPWRENTTRYLP